MARAKLVLIIDDDFSTREGLRALLEFKGYEARTAADGDDALRQLRAGLRPCIIVLDLMMPGKDGHQFRAEQLADAELAAIPVVVYSGRHDPGRSAASLRAVAHFQKPINIENIVQIIERHCLCS